MILNAHFQRQQGQQPETDSFRASMSILIDNNCTRQVISNNNDKL